MFVHGDLQSEWRGHEHSPPRAPDGPQWAMPPPFAPFRWHLKTLSAKETLSGALVLWVQRQPAPLERLAS